MKREYYSDSISNFCTTKKEEILGFLTTGSVNAGFKVEAMQHGAWAKQMEILQKVLKGRKGKVYFEYSIPRMGQRIDVLLIMGPVIFVLEFKIGAEDFSSYAIDQVVDYALDLKNFHDTSHKQIIAPVLIATEAAEGFFAPSTTADNPTLLDPIKCTSSQLTAVLDAILQFASGPRINPEEWEQGHYCPTPTIIEAAMALYRGHSVKEISRSDAGAEDLHKTTQTVSEIIRKSSDSRRKSICFVTGVPGAGKTLVGLNIATTNTDKNSKLYSVFLSGNGPLVAVMREALARDKVRFEKQKGRRITKKSILSEVKSFVQNVHHFRNDCVEDPGAPIEHVALFDEAQRAWNLDQTVKFMRRMGHDDFNKSEPEFLISCMDRHPDWAVIVCLVGGGQEINTGEAGISEWIDSVIRGYPKWDVYVSSKLTDSEYASGEALEKLKLSTLKVAYKDELHLRVSMRSFRAENVSNLVKEILDRDTKRARETLKQVTEKGYPIFISRDLHKAKEWLRKKAQGSERYGLVVSSQAERLKPYAIDVKSTIDPIHWFLDSKKDVRSSYYLEDVATEFHIQGLELDYACVAWDADFRYTPKGWENWSFCGEKWKHINKPERKQYQKNAYRVLLTRARQGMVIVVPHGNPKDPTRAPHYYDSTYSYLQSIGFSELK